MPKGSIFATSACRHTINQIQLQELANFLIQYRSLVTLPDTRLMLSTKSFIETPINQVYTKLIEANKDKLFGFVNVPVNLTAPEILTYNHIAFDVTQMPDEIQKTIDISPGYKDKIIFNVTSLVKANTELANVAMFQSQFVRDLLSRSYFRSNEMWLSATAVQYLCKTYSMSVAAAIGRAYNLGLTEQQMVGAIFSLFFLKQVAKDSDAEVMLTNSDRLLVSTIDVRDVITHVKNTLKDRYATMSLDDACACVHALGINRLAEVNRRFLYTKLRTIGPDVNSSAIALEYPPYWAHLILLAASGQKTGLAFTLKAFGLLKNATTFAEDLTRNQAFLAGIA